MDTDLHKLKKLPSLNLKRDSTTSGEDPDADDDHKYTSLKDIILVSPPHHAPNNEANGFDSSAISIRNELVKHAASAYVQSAVLAINRNQNCFAAIWMEIKNKVACCSCWRSHVRKPLRACFRPIFRFLDYMVNGVLGRAWRGRNAIT
uniref:Putative E3 ubiquitin-protein ligase arkadia-A n=1 Tax=Davidia involucrata TaxID=16924 RepID=A0A5B7BBP4_DAVIN